MRLGTLSFEMQGNALALPGGTRRELIAHVVSTHKPDLLVCAGHSVDNDEDLARLAKDGRVVNGKGSLIVEVRTARDLATAWATGTLPTEASLHRIYLISPGGGVKSLGHQVIIQSRDLSGPAYQKRTQLFEDLITEKTTMVNGYKLFAICCGEINVLKGVRRLRHNFPVSDVRYSKPPSW